MLGKRPSKKQSERAALRDKVRQRGPSETLAPAAPDVPLDPLYAHATLGVALKAIREAKKLTLQQVTDETRVRRAYLEAIETSQLDLLPSRPFTIGYVRAYANALGVDPDAAVERFKIDEPVLEEPLRAPVGVLDDRDPRVAAFLIGALVIVAAIVLWNVAQRAMIANAPPPALAAQATVEKALRSMKPAAMELGAPLPAPVESTTPPPYETPGLAKALGLEPATDPTRPKPATEAPSVNLAALPAIFTPLGKVYDAGNPQIRSVVTLQALKPVALIIRGADGSVYFARQLSKGDAFKVPQLAGLTLDVSNANDLQVFVYGQSKGVLPAAQVLVSKLATPPSAAPAAAPKPAPKTSTP